MFLESSQPLRCSEMARDNSDSSLSHPHVPPPVFITAGEIYNKSNFKFLLKNTDGMANILPGARFRKSDKGYNEKEICFWYTKHHFDPLTAIGIENDKDGKPERHRLLIMDGHGSHLTTDIIRYYLERKIHILCLPGHSTHRLQPLDVGIFRPLDKAYKKEVSD